MITIRKLEKANDLRELTALSRQFFLEYEAHNEEFFQVDRLDERDIVDYFSRFVETPDAAAWVAETADESVGYITVYIQEQPSYWKVKRIGHISGLMVRAEDRRKGIAERLLTNAVDFFQQRGLTYFTVYTAAANEGAVRFYERQRMTPLYTTLIGRIEDIGR